MSGKPVMLMTGDCVSQMKRIPDGYINCVVTSPPYFGLRDYGTEGQTGLERSPADYVTALVAVFREVRRVLRNDGTVWLNLGDSFAGSGKGRNADGTHQGGGVQGTNRGTINGRISKTGIGEGFKGKDLMMIPARVAIALCDDGWFLRSDIIWDKINPMPESVKDRPTRSHEYVFLLTKSQTYYYDSKSIAEPTSFLSLSQQESKNRRDVWRINTSSYKGAHFATFPHELARRCVLAGCPEGGLALDPFCGSGTVGQVCVENNRRFLGIDISPEYMELAKKRIKAAQEAKLSRVATRD